MAPKRKNVEVVEEEVESQEEEEEEEDEELAFSRNYFLAKEVGSSSGKRSAARKVSEINLVDEQVRFSRVFHNFVVFLCRSSSICYHWAPNLCCRSLESNSSLVLQIINLNSKWLFCFLNKLTNLIKACVISRIWIKCFFSAFRVDEKNIMWLYKSVIVLFKDI